MKIAIDLQCCQSLSASRGVGRFANNIIREFIKNKDDEFIFVINSNLKAINLFIDDLKSSNRNIKTVIWNPLSIATGYSFADRVGFAANCEQLSDIISDIDPDIAFFPSILSELNSNFVPYIPFSNQNFLTATVLYDFIPLQFSDKFFLENSYARYYYEHILKSIVRYDILFTISEYVKKYANSHLGINDVINIYCGADEQIINATTSSIDIKNFREKYNLSGKTILSVAGNDLSKNIPGLIAAYLRLDETIKERYKLVLVGKNNDSLILQNDKAHENIVAIPEVDDGILNFLYSSSSLYISPSLVEGFGMTPLEAIKCGTPALVSSESSLPEVVGCSDALFNANDPENISEKMLEVLSDEKLKQKILNFEQEHVKKFSWRKTASKAKKAFCRSEDVKAKPFTVLFHTWQGAFNCPGGGEYQLLSYEKELSKRGIRVLRYDPWHPQFDEADIVHHFSSHTESIDFCYLAHDKKIPVICSSIFWPGIIYRENMGNIKKLYEICDLILPNSDVECDLLSDIMGLDKNKFHKVVNGVDEKFFIHTTGELFRQTFEIQDEFILCFGNIEPRKNQLALITSLKGRGKRLLLAGNIRDSAYAEQCFSTGSDFVTYLGNLEHGSELQISAYAAADLFVLPSLLETPGLAALEAAAQNCRIAITCIGSTKEYFNDYVEYLNPYDHESIINSIESAFSKPRPTNLSTYVHDNFTWNICGERLIQLYKFISRAYPIKFNTSKKNKFFRKKYDFNSRRYLHFQGEKQSKHSTGIIKIENGCYNLILSYSLVCCFEKLRMTIKINEQEKYIKYLKAGFDEKISLNFFLNNNINIFEAVFDVGNDIYFQLNDFNISHLDTIVDEYDFFDSEEVTFNFHENNYAVLEQSGNHEIAIDARKSDYIFKIAPGAKSARLENISFKNDSRFVNCIDIRNYKCLLIEDNFFIDNRIILSICQKNKPCIAKQSGGSFIFENSSFQIEKYNLIPVDPLNYISYNFNPSNDEFIEQFGWHDAEINGTWTKTGISGLKIWLKAVDYILNISFKVFLGTRAQFPVKIFLNNKLIIEENIIDNEIQEICTRLEKCNINNGLNILEFRTSDELESPEECSIGNDIRKLGIKLCKFNLKAVEAIIGDLYLSPFTPNATQILGETGWNEAEESGTWSRCRTSTISLVLDKNDYFLNASVKPFLCKDTYPELEVIVNGEILEEVVFNDNEIYDINIFIPARLLVTKITKIEFRLSTDPKSPFECLGIGDNRKLGIKLCKFNLKAVEAIICDLYLSPFTPNATQILGETGWNEAEESGTWSRCRTSTISLVLGENDYFLNASVKPFLCKDTYPELEVIVNGEILEEVVFNDNEIYDINIFIPARLLVTKITKIEFRLSTDPKSPFECLAAEDNRKLGIKLSKFNISQICIKATKIVLDPFMPEYPCLLGSYGWNNHEVWGTWSSSTYSGFYVSMRPGRYKFIVKMNSFQNKKYKIKIYHNKILLDELSIHDSITYECIINIIYNSALKYDEFSFKTEELFCPVKLGLGEDDRKLGFALSSVELIAC